jgi:antitoxin component of MazEF toxin-antitoxin module
MGDLTFKRQLSKTGTTKYISIPEPALQALEWVDGEKLELVVKANGEVVIRPQARQESLALAAANSASKTKRKKNK